MGDTKVKLDVRNKKLFITSDLYEYIHINPEGNVQIELKALPELTEENNE